MTLFFSFMGSYMLHHYSTRMIQDIYLLPDGRTIEVSFFNAFWVSSSADNFWLFLQIPKTEKLRISNLGYFQASRLYNVELATYM